MEFPELNIEQYRSGYNHTGLPDKFEKTALGWQLKIAALDCQHKIGAQVKKWDGGKEELYKIAVFASLHARLAILKAGNNADEDIIKMIIYQCQQDYQIALAKLLGAQDANSI